MDFTELIMWLVIIILLPLNCHGMDNKMTEDELEEYYTFYDEDGNPRNQQTPENSRMGLTEHENEVWNHGNQSNNFPPPLPDENSNPNNGKKKKKKNHLFIFLKSFGILIFLVSRLDRSTSDAGIPPSFNSSKTTGNSTNESMGQFSPTVEPVSMGSTNSSANAHGRASTNSSANAHGSTPNVSDTATNVSTKSFNRFLSLLPRNTTFQKLPFNDSIIFSDDDDDDFNNDTQSEQFFTNFRNDIRRSNDQTIVHTDFTLRSEFFFIYFKKIILKNNILLFFKFLVGSKIREIRNYVWGNRIDIGSNFSGNGNSIETKTSISLRNGSSTPILGFGVLLFAVLFNWA